MALFPQEACSCVQDFCRITRRPATSQFLKRSVCKTLFLAHPFRLRKTTTNPYFLVHVNTWCPMLGIQNFKLYLWTWLYRCYVYQLLSSGWHQNCWLISCRYLSTHILAHRLLVWQMVLFVLLTRLFKTESDCRHPFNYFILCCCIVWKSSFLLKLWEREEV